MPDLHDLELNLKSPTPILVIETLEEQRLLSQFTRLGIKLMQPVYQWTLTDGLRRAESDPPQTIMNTDTPEQALRHIRATTQAGLYLLLDFHPFANEPLLTRLLKEIAQDYDQIARKLVLISHALEIPPEIRHLCARMHLRLPDTNTLFQVIRDEVKRYTERHGHSPRADRDAVKQLARHSTGLTLSDARMMIRNAIENDGAITRKDIEEVLSAKQAMLNQAGLLAFETNTAHFKDVAGLGNLKTWVELRRKRLLEGKRHKDRPRGVLLLGVQGGGKSLAARAIAGQLGLPLLRLDFASLYNKYIGETEKNLRDALEAARAMTPCVLWIDEIEKGVASSGEDSGVSTRILGTLLTWMADNQQGVFIVATANDIQRLPPELIRKGRLDEIFFVDLPAPQARREIIEIHLRKRNLAPGQFDLDRLAELSDGFSGAEIEQAIIAAVYAADANDTRADSDSIADELCRTRPLSVVMDGQIDALRRWAADRTVPA